MPTVRLCLLGFSSIQWLSLRVRDVHWFLYNVDCNKSGDVLAKNPIVHKITGLVLTYLRTFLVLEADIPWYTSLDYGPSFNEWTEDDFRSAINSVIQALPNNKFVTIVSDWCSLILPVRCTILLINARSCRKCCVWITNSSQIFLCIRSVSYYSFFNFSQMLHILVRSGAQRWRTWRWPWLIPTWCPSSGLNSFIHSLSLSIEALSQSRRSRIITMWWCTSSSGVVTRSLARAR